MDTSAQRSRLGPSRSGRLRLGIMSGGLAITLALAPSIAALGATVTRGDISAFATGAGLPISGRAEMIRTPEGRTIVTVHVEGLAPNTTYASHVHKQACADGEADGHYRFDPAGAATPPNEIWPGPFTTNDAGVGNANTIADGIAGAAAVSVVVHAPGGAKIACADLA